MIAAATMRPPKIRPSALPALAECPCFVGKSSPDTERGDKAHKAMERLLKHNDPLLLQDLDTDEREGVEWAVDYIRLKAPTLDHPIQFETNRMLLDQDFEQLCPGTPDVTCGPHLFDLKSRERNYRQQMACYVLMMIQDGGWPEVTVHMLYRATQQARTFTLTEAECWALIEPVVASARNPERQPTPCSYCDWCSNAPVCPALLAGVNAVVAGRPDWSLETYHSSDISDPMQAAKALRIAKRLGAWCEAVEHHVKELAVKQGVEIPGFKLQTRQGNRFIEDIMAAFSAMRMPQEEFLKACEVKFSRLAETTARLHGMKKTASERDVEAKLGELVKRKPASVSLVESKEKEEADATVQ